MSLTRHLRGIAAIIVGVGSGLGGGSAGTRPASPGTAPSPSAVSLGLSGTVTPSAVGGARGKPAGFGI